MEISNSLDSPVQTAVTAQLLNAMQAQGASMINMIASAPVQQGSSNRPGQGLHIDIRA
jgi:hypothetical protein